MSARHHRPHRITGWRATATAATLAIGVALAGCAGGGGAFDSPVAEVRSAVDRGDRTAALQSLDDLSVSALTAHERGDITDAELAEATALIDSSRALVDQVIGVPETTTTLAPTSTVPVTEKDEPDKDEDKKKKDDDKDDDKD